MPAGHTERETINERRPLTRRMRECLALVRTVERKGREVRLADLHSADRNAARALRDRGLLLFGERTAPIQTTEAGRRALAEL